MTRIQFDENVFGTIVPLNQGDIPTIDIKCKNGHYLTTITIHPFMRIETIKIHCFKCNVITVANNLWMQYKGKAPDG